MKDKILIRTDLITRRHIIDEVATLVSTLNHKALPLFEHLMIPVTIENAMKYCVKGGKEKIINEFEKESETCAINVQKIWIEKLLNDYPDFPQFNVNSRMFYLFKCVKIANISTDYITIDALNVVVHNTRTSPGFVIDPDQVEEESKIYLDKENYKEYQKLCDLANQLNDYFKKVKDKSEFFPMCIFTSDKEISINDEFIDNHFFQKIKGKS